MQVREQQRSLTRRAVEDYPLGHSIPEQRRLAEQGLILRPLTERFFRDAGIGRGMHVLDVGCGVGDVTCLAAELVGSMGTAVGVDFAGPVLTTARARALARGIDWARFVEADVTTLTLDRLECAAVRRGRGSAGAHVSGRPHRGPPPPVAAGAARRHRRVSRGRRAPRASLAGTPAVRRLDRPGAGDLRAERRHDRHGAPAAPDVSRRRAAGAGYAARGHRHQPAPTCRGLQWFSELVRSMAPGDGADWAWRGWARTSSTLLADRLVEEAMAAPGAVCDLALGGAWAQTAAPAARA